MAVRLAIFVSQLTAISALKYRLSQNQVVDVANLEAEEWQSISDLYQTHRRAKQKHPPPVLDAELSEIGLYEYWGDYEFEHDPRGILFDKDDIYYHNYYTEQVAKHKLLRPSQVDACSVGSFFCPSSHGSHGHCLEKNVTTSLNLICDGVCDCLNCADESHCTSLKSIKGVLYGNTTTDLYCDNKYLPDIWKCDGYCDCSGCNDEDRSGKVCKKYPGNASSKAYKNQNHADYCQSSQVKCNGVADCLDGSDESTCEAGSIMRNKKLDADLNFKKCKDYSSSKQVYHYRFKCDGIFDCSDKSDELNCEKYLKEKETKCTRAHFSSKDSLSDQGGLLCRTPNQPYICMDATQVCNNRDSSSNKYQNLECFFDGKVEKLSESYACNGITICRYDEFRCIKNGKYICLNTAEYLCNGKNECDDSVIDKNKTTVTGKINSDGVDAIAPRFLDFDAIQQQLSDLMKLGNKALGGYNFNGNFNDENSTLCDAIKTNKCKASCIADFKDSNCNKYKPLEIDSLGNCDCRCTECIDGFEASAEGCIDINECAVNTFRNEHHPCSHGCINTIGSYRCNCPAGLVLSLDMKTCRPIDADKLPVQLHVTGKGNVMTLTLNKNNLNNEWEIVAQKNLRFFQKYPKSVFTGIAVDELNAESTDESTRGKSIIYVGSYNGLGTSDMPAATILKYDEVTEETEIFYSFKSGKIEGMDFDPINGGLYVVLSDYVNNGCGSEGQQKSSKSGLLAAFPTRAKNNQNVPSLSTNGVYLRKPRGIISVPHLSFLYVADWIDSGSFSILYRFHFGTVLKSTLDVKSKTLKIKYANQIVHDRFRQRILILDGQSDNSMLVSCDYWLNKCKNVFKLGTSHAFSGIISGKEMFITEMNIPEIKIQQVSYSPNVRVLKRFDFQVYGLSFSNYGIRDLADSIINPEVCQDKKCDYFCVTHSSSHWKHKKELDPKLDMEKIENSNHTAISQRALNHGSEFEERSNFHGLLGATCMCPDGTFSYESKVCKVPDQNKAVKVMGVLVGNTVNGKHDNYYYGKTNTLLMDMETGQTGYKTLNHRINFNEFDTLVPSAYNPYDYSVYLHSEYLTARNKEISEDLSQSERTRQALVKIPKMTLHSAKCQAPTLTNFMLDYSAADSDQNLDYLDITNTNMDKSGNAMHVKIHPDKLASFLINSKTFPEVNLVCAETTVYSLDNSFTRHSLVCRKLDKFYQRKFFILLDLENYLKVGSYIIDYALDTQGVTLLVKHTDGKYDTHFYNFGDDVPIVKIDLVSQIMTLHEGIKKTLEDQYAAIHNVTQILHTSTAFQMAYLSTPTEVLLLDSVNAHLFLVYDFEKELNFKSCNSDNHYVSRATFANFRKFNMSASTDKIYMSHQLVCREKTTFKMTIINYLVTCEIDKTQNWVGLPKKFVNCQVFPATISNSVHKFDVEEKFNKEDFHGDNYRITLIDFVKIGKIDQQDIPMNNKFCSKCEFGCAQKFIDQAKKLKVGSRKRRDLLDQDDLNPFDQEEYHQSLYFKKGKKRWRQHLDDFEKFQQKIQDRKMNYYAEQEMDIRDAVSGETVTDPRDPKMGDMCLCPFGLSMNSSTNKCIDPTACYKHCAKKGEPNKQVCLKIEDRCNGIAQCDDGSDEANCFKKCGLDEFRCETTRLKSECVNYTKLCQGQISDKTKGYCANNRDIDSQVCNQNKYMCDWNEVLCVEKSTYNKYYSGYDFWSSSVKSSSQETGYCLPMGLVQNGEKNCGPNYMDEETPAYWKDMCFMSGGFWCKRSYKCISYSQVCDGVNDCGVSSLSYSYTYTKTSYTDTTDEIDCQKFGLNCNEVTHYRCPSSGQCINRKHLCQGIARCPHAEDLLECKHVKPVEKVQVKHFFPDTLAAYYNDQPCNSSMYCISFDAPHKQICLTDSMLCDNIKHCRNGMDEGETCKTACDLNYTDRITCGSCTPTPWGPKCNCQTKPGQPVLKEFVKKESNQPGTCEYINFCKYEGTCDQKCTHLNGKLDEQTKMPFLCSCKKWWYPYGERNEHCEKTDLGQFFYLTNGGEIKWTRLLLPPHHYKKYSSNPENENEKRDVKDLISFTNSSSTSEAKKAHYNRLSIVRKINNLKHGHVANTVKFFTYDMHQKQIFTVETDRDGFDTIYIQDSNQFWSNETTPFTFDRPINLPRMVITAICPSSTFYPDFTNILYTAAMVPESAGSTRSRNVIYAVNIASKAAILLELENSRGENPSAHLLYYLGIRHSLYIGWGTKLMKYDLFTDQTTVLYDFDDHKLIKMVFDDGLDRFYGVLSSTKNTKKSDTPDQIIYFDIDGFQPVEHVYVHPPVYGISDIMIIGRILIIFDKFTYGNIYDKFTGHTFDMQDTEDGLHFVDQDPVVNAGIKRSNADNLFAKQMLNAFQAIKPNANFYTHEIPESFLVKQAIQVNQFAKTTYTSDYKRLIRKKYGDSYTMKLNDSRDSNAKICPQNTLEISEFNSLKDEEIRACYCLGWYLEGGNNMQETRTGKSLNATDQANGDGSESSSSSSGGVIYYSGTQKSSRVDLIDKKDYATAFPCGRPTCDNDVLERNNYLRRSKTKEIEKLGMSIENGDPINEESEELLLRTDLKEDESIRLASMTCLDKNFKVYELQENKEDYMNFYTKSLHKNKLVNTNTDLYFTVCNRIGQYYPDRKFNLTSGNRKKIDSKLLHTYDLKIDTLAWLPSSFPTLLKSRKQDELYMYDEYYDPFGLALPFCDTPDDLYAYPEDMLYENKINCTASCPFACVPFEVYQTKDTNTNQTRSNYTFSQMSRDKITKYFCDCPNYLYGKTCQYKRPTAESIVSYYTPSTARKVWSVIGILIGGLLGILLYECCCNSRLNLANLNPYKQQNLFSYKDLHNDVDDGFNNLNKLPIDHDKTNAWSQNNNTYENYGPASDYHDNSLQKNRLDSVGTQQTMTENVTKASDFATYRKVNSQTNLVENCMGFNIPNGDIRGEAREAVARDGQPGSTQTNNMNHSQNSTIYSNWDEEVHKPEFNSSVNNDYMNDMNQNANLLNLNDDEDNLSIGINAHNLKNNKGGGNIIKNPFFKESKRQEDQTNLLDL